VLKEFEEGNTMYDVIRYQIHENTIDYFCFNDKEEEQFQTAMDEDSSLVKFKNKFHNTAKKSLKKLIEKSVAVLPFDVNRCLNSIAVITLKAQMELISNCIKISTPPPKIV
jgi:uncharacterized protein YjaZ